MPLPSPCDADGAGAPDLPLHGVRVLDLTTTLAGPSATRHLVDFGAEVVKVESTTHPDSTRLGKPYAGGVLAGWNSSGYFSAYNAGKRSIVLNLDAPEGRILAHRLIAVSDVLVESFRPGVMERLGMGWDDVRRTNSRIVMASHSLQGQTGPRRTMRGYGQLTTAMAGWFDTTVEPGAEPAGLYSAYTDFVAWPLFLAAILLALEHRDATGEGQWIDQSHLEASAYFCGPELLAEQLGPTTGRTGNAQLSRCPENVFRCAGEDSWCAISVSTDAEWQALCDVLGAHDLATDPTLARLTERKRQEQAVEAAVEARTRAWDGRELAQALMDRSVPAAPVYDARDLFLDAQVRHRGALRRLSHEVLGDHAVLRPALRLSVMRTELDAGPHRPFPDLGADTLAVCEEMLGLTRSEISELADAGVFA